MVPIDEETLALLDRIAEHRSPGRPLPHPRTGKLASFLLTHQGRRVSAHTLRAELTRAADQAGIGAATPHQLRHTFVICTGFSARGTTESGPCRIVPQKYLSLCEARTTRPVPGSFSLRCCF